MVFSSLAYTRLILLVLIQSQGQARIDVCLLLMGRALQNFCADRASAGGKVISVG